MRRKPSVQRAFDEARFGPSRILNVRDSLPTAAEAVQRAEAWLRSKQVERAGEVLIVTGRGRASVDGIPVIRTAIERLLARLKRKGVVAAVREHTPGSFLVHLAPLRALFEAPARGRDQRHAPPTGVAASLVGLNPALLALLRQLSRRALESLGIVEPTDRMIASEMERHFSLLTRGMPPGGASESALTAAIERALHEYDEADR